MTRQARKEDRESEGRKSRVPLGVPRSKLTVPQREGYHRRWINDVPGRLHAAGQAGWEYVEDPDLHVGDGAESGNSDMGSRVSRLVGKTESGGPLRAYLMEIKQEFYEEDQAAKLAVVDETDRAIREGKIGDDQEGRYVPKGGIKIS